MNTEPTDEQINRGIAEWMGWIIVEDGDHSFTTSHDACHEALERMTDRQLVYYVWELEEMLGDGIAHLHRATARQKALAIYRTITTKP